MNRHLFKIHGQRSKDLFQCPTCNKTYSRKCVFENHMKQPHCSVFTCKNCNETFDDRKSLQKHRVTQCYKFNAICNICGFKAERKTKLRRHMLGVHKIIENGVFLCEICNIPFTSKLLFERHKEKHKTSSFICNQCLQSFPDYKVLKKHKRMTHKRLFCKQCSATFQDDHHLKVCGIDLSL